ncbi:HDOD domain-containing protein [Delftia acidovorans]|uniref:HDOD domain-containing protein n=1 Tax=Delftia acidovorans TaxID=80866 RepID=UPI00359FF740
MAAHALDLQTLLTQTLALPAQPRIVALLLRELVPEQPSLRRLSQLFAADPALAAGLLAQANGPVFGMAGRVTGIPEALALLAPAQLRQIVRGMPLGVGTHAVPGVAMPAFWRYSVDAARVARALAGTVQASPTAAYAAGLLHGLGELAMHMIDPGRAATISELVDPLDPRRAEVEMRLCGYAYSHVTPGLPPRWNLPPLLADALQHLHAPLAQPGFDPLACVLHIAAWRARSREAQWGERALAVSFPGEVGVALGLDIDMVLRQDPVDWMADTGLDVLL